METGHCDAVNMRLLGHCDLAGNGNGGEGIGIHVKDGRRLLYIAHECEPVNFSIVDVTDPRRPSLVAQERLPHEQVRSNSLAVFGDLMLVAYQVKQPGLQPAGVEVFDLQDPTSPKSIGFFDASGPDSRGTHCLWFVDGRYAYISSGTPDSRPRNRKDDQFPVILDLSDPTRPVEVGRWWLPGTQHGDTADPPERHTRFDSGFRSHNVNVYPERPDRAYVGYLDGGIIILDISDLDSPRMISRLDYHPPMPGFTHSVLPLFGRELLAVTDESTKDAAADYPKLLWMIDASHETSPMIIGNAPLPPVQDYANRGGRFGAHNLHENDPGPLSWHSDDVIIGAFFNAGVRAYDIKNPFQPVEIAHFVPPAPQGSPAGAIQMNDVYVDERRIIYAVDRLTGGLYVLDADI